ncbi:MAG: amino acid adenylation domain-containing protein [Pseudomonadota bacterium]
MLQVQDIVRLCAKSNISLSVVGENIKVSGNKDNLSPEILNGLKSKKGELIDFISRFKNSAKGEHSWGKISSKNDYELATLSYAQQRLWILDRLSTDGVEYNLPMRFRLEGHFSETICRRVIEAIVERHSVLRTIFISYQDEVKSRVLKNYSVPVDFFNMHELSATEQIKKVDTIITDDSKKRFDFNKDTLLRAKIFSLSDTDHIIYINIHHIAADGWSLGILYKEFNQLYKSFSQGSESTLAALPVQYADYAEWQRKWLDSGVMAEQLDFWIEQLRDLPELHSLPLDKPRPTQQTYNGAIHSQIIDASLVERVNNFCRRRNVTLFMFLQSALSVLFNRYSGDEDIVIGTPIAGRSHADVEGLIGLFVNTLVLRSKVSDTVNFEELLLQNKSMVLSAFENQHVPFEVLVENIKPQRSLSYSPLFQIMLTLHNNEKMRIDIDGMSVKENIHTGNSIKFDLEIVTSEQDGKIYVDWTYGTDLFEDPTIARMATHFELLIRYLLDNEKAPISELNFLCDQESNRFLECNSTAMEFSNLGRLENIFEVQAALLPTQIAIKSVDKNLSYFSLNEEANRLANYLIGCGVQPMDSVAICMQRDCDFVLTILAILKAGACYVPCDPNYPRERLNKMLEAARTKLVLVDDQGSLVINGDRQVINIKDALSHIISGNLASENLNLSHDVEAPACIIFTSGSTGNPKGVVLSHQGIANRIFWMKSQYPANVNDIFVQKTSLNFVDHIAEIFQPLCEGATNIIVADDLLKDSEAFIHLLQENKVTHLTLVPSLLHMLLQDKTFCAISSLKQIITSGETLGTQLVKQLLTTFNSVRLLNLYGSSEVSADILYKEVTPQDVTTQIPIGRPIANNKVYLLNKHGYPVPVGVQAEIYVSGVGLAKGYLEENHDQERDRFVHFLHIDNGIRLYRTGDLAKRLPNGELQFIGRNDDQIKIRGLRIEAGEIQSQLLALEGINEALVGLYKSESGDEQLIAYVTLIASNSDINIREYCLSALQEKLPAYMVPDIFIILDEMPRTSTGKISKRLLPAPSAKDLLRQTYVAPRNSIELLMAKLWSEVLNVNAIGIGDNFFRLGGHSLLAAKLVSRIRREMGVEISLKHLFEYPTLAALTEKINSLTAAEQVMLPVIPLSLEQKKYPSYAQQRLWFLNKLGEASVEYNLPMQLRVAGEFNTQAFCAAIQEIVKRHEVLRTVITSEEGEARARVLQEYYVPITVHDLSQLAPDAKALELEALIAEDCKHSFNFCSDIMLRAHIFCLSQDDYVLFFNIHHIAIDGWSLAIFYRELNNFYNVYAKGGQSQFKDLPIQYGDFAVWQRDWLNNPRQKMQLDYWKTQLHGLPKVHALPLDKSRPPRQTFNGDVYYQDLGSHLLQRIKTFCYQEQLTPYMFLQTAFCILLSRYSREQDIVMGTPVAGRNQAEIENLIGFFVNTLVLRSSVDGSVTVRQLLRNNATIIMDAFTHQDVPMEFLVDELKPERSGSHSPLFQILFTLHNNQKHDFAFDGLLLTENLSFKHQIKFDLELEAFELNESLGLNWAFNTDLFEQITITQFAANFQALLQVMLDCTDEVISQLSLINSEEKIGLLCESDTYNIVVSDEMHVAQLFEQQVLSAPDSLAVKDNHESLSYRQLNARANQLAAHMRTLGVGPEVLVGVCLPRTADLLVALLAVFKSGGAYVPLDPHYPADRIEYMIEDSRASLLITESTLFKSGNSVNTLCINNAAVRQTLKTYDTENLPALASRNCAAYVIYTSGSTGKPKGVCVEQKALCNFLLSMAQHPGLDKNDKLLAVTSVSFDIAGLEMYLPLIQGASLYIADENQVKDSAALQQLIVNENISVMQATPATWRLLLAGNWKGHPELKVLCGGEAWPVSLNDQLQSRVKTVWNVYGPTETTIWSTVNKIEAGVASVTLGQPIANTRIYILDEHCNLVPRGGIGELYIGGDGVARGYLHREDLTASRFLDSPFKAGERIYRTGDLARWRTDNSLQYLGRSDFQVKVRGYRVEVEEIEKNLLQLEFVENAVVSVCEREQENNSGFLVAYIIPANSAQTSDYEQYQTGWIEQCKSHLSNLLPKYMVPECYLFLDAFPLTLNNKIDRKALPKVNVDQYYSVAYEAPTSPEEQIVCDAIKKALCLEKVGIDDNFFALGGDSISAIKFLNGLREFGLDINLQEIFDKSSNKALVKLLRPYIPIENLVPFCLLNTEERSKISDDYDDIYPISSSQLGLLLHSELHPETYNNVFNVRVKAMWNEPIFLNALESLVKEHPVLRTSFDMSSGDRSLQYVHRKIKLPCIVESVDANNAEKVISNYTNRSSKQKYDYQNAPLFSIRIFILDDKQFEYCLSFHHVIMDGWSASSFTNSLFDHYCSVLKGNKVIEPIVNWQFRRAIANELKAANDIQQQKYWRSCLDNQPDRQLPVITESQSEQNLISSFNEKFLTLSPAVIGLARRLCVPVQAVLLAIHFRVLSSWSGSRKVVSTIGISARPHAQGGDTALGLFVNALPMLEELNYSEPWEAFIKTVAQNWSKCNEFGKYPISQAGKMQTEILFNYTHFKTLDNGRKEDSIEIIGSQFHEKTNFDFHVSFYRQSTDEKIYMEVKYNQALYEVDTINRILDSYCRVTAGLLQRPMELVGKAIALPEADERKFAQWNTTQCDYAQNLCIHEHFESVAKKQSDATAIVFPDGELTYGELNNKANKLAHYLRAQGVEAEEFVAVLIEPSINVVISILAILKAGAAYVPIDIHYPQQRIESILEDSRARFALYCNNYNFVFPSHVTPLCIDNRAQDVLASFSEKNIAVSTSGALPNSLAYMIYTSGSTGKPKGVMIEHKNIFALVADKNYVKIGKHSVIAQASSIAFDAATFEIWGALTAGAKLVHIEKEKLLDTAMIGQELTQKGITVLFITTALFNKIAFDKPDSFSSLQCLLFGGEQASYDAVNIVIKENSTVRILHVYGPTETTTFACYSHLSGVYDAHRRLPIGKPMANTRFYVMHNGEILPSGTRGELFIGGDGTGRGYWQQAALSAEKFLPDHNSEGCKLYATGDIVKWMSDGEIEFVGRHDRQVKIRGFRIELDEIEKTVNALDAVDACYILTHVRDGNIGIVCYLVATTKNFTTADIRSLKSELKKLLPDYMMPSAFISITEFPLTTNGKINKQQLPIPLPEHYVSEEFIALSGDLECKIGEAWSKVLGIIKPGAKDNFFDIGGSSLLAVKLRNSIVKAVGKPLSISNIFTYPTIASQAEFLSQGEQEIVSSTDTFSGVFDIAVIGMAGRFPGASNVDEYWQNIRAGKEIIKQFSDDELLEAGVSQHLLQQKNYVKCGVVLEGLELFDADFFDFTPREAQVLDPQQRLLFECTQEVLEDGGYANTDKPQKIGTFISVADSRYLWENINTQPELYDVLGGMTIRNANAKDSAATRLAYKFNLLGPSVNVNTACSSSLVAVHEACKSLWLGESKMAIAGGADIHLLKPQGYLYTEGDVLSSNGSCHAFDQNANGTRIGSGCGLVLLKPLSSALQDNDNIHAVIKGSAINNDGARKVGYTAPSVIGQAECIRRAVDMAGIDPKTVNYIEAHGTGTIIGDPIEIEALGKVYGNRQLDDLCAIGTVKPNIGHLNAAAGIAGLIKTVCAVKNKEIPPLVNFTELNTEIKSNSNAFAFNSGLRSWMEGLHARRAAVSSFGIGGTNSHVIVEEYQSKNIQENLNAIPPQLLILSAGTSEALASTRRRLYKHITTAASLNIQDIAYSLQTGRRLGKYVQLFTCNSEHELLEKLNQNDDQIKLTKVDKSKAKPRVVFMFPGQGSQYHGMARGLYECYPYFREVLDSCAHLATSYLQQDILSILGITQTDHPKEALENLLKETSISQPVIFSVEYSLAKLLMSWGIEPETMIGHSLGEYVAACLAGVFSLEDAIKLVCKRGALMQSQLPGGMLAINASVEIIDVVMRFDCEIAAENSLEHCVASGSHEQIAHLKDYLDVQGIKCSHLHTSHAFHSKFMEPMLEDFEEVLEQVSLSNPKLSYISSFTGTDIAQHNVSDTQYWLNHLRHTVKFHQGLTSLLDKGHNIFIEVGPGTTLSTFARSARNLGDRKLVSSMRSPKVMKEDTHHILNMLGELHQCGVAVNWNAVHFNRKCHKVSLPTYVFSRQHYWVDAKVKDVGKSFSSYCVDAVDDQVLSPAWTREPLSVVTVFQEKTPTLWLLVGENQQWNSVLENHLQALGNKCIQISFADTYSANPRGYQLGSDVQVGFSKVIADCQEKYALPIKVVFTTNQLDGSTQHKDFERICAAQYHGLYPLVALVRATNSLKQQNCLPVKCYLLTDSLFDVVGTEALRFDHSLAAGVCHSINQECPNFNVQHIDLCGVNDFSAKKSTGYYESVIQNVLAEIQADIAKDVVAYRSGIRWIRSYLPKKASLSEAKLRHAGVYVITGGMGKIGVALANFLRENFAAKVVLLTRSSLDHVNFNQLPEPNHKQKLADGKLMFCHYDQAPLLAIATADPSNLEDMQYIFDTIENELGSINGVIHSAGQTKNIIASIHDVDTSVCHQQFEPKIHGTLVLDKLLENRQVDFCMLMSSLSTVLGGIGYGIYAGVNSFMDAFSAYKHRQGDARWLSVNWDGWQFDTHNLSNANDSNVSLTRAEGADLFAQLQRFSGFPQLLACKGNFSSRYQRWVLNADVSNRKFTSTLIANPKIISVEEPVSIESDIKNIWRKLFGIDDIALNDNFFEIGGDSLLLARLVANLNTVFSKDIKVSIKDMFNCPTIRQMADLVRLSVSVNVEEQSLLDEAYCEEGEI